MSMWRYDMRYDRGKLFSPPPHTHTFKRVETLRPAPLYHYFFNLLCTVLELPENFLCPPFSMAKTPAHPPLFVAVQLNLPPSHFVAPPPRPAISDHTRTCHVHLVNRK